MKKRVRKLGWNARNADGVEKWVSYVWPSCELCLGKILNMEGRGCRPLDRDERGRGEGGEVVFRECGKTDSECRVL